MTGPEMAADFVAARVAEGSDYIKVIADVPGPSQETLNAVIAAAHSYKKLVIAHASEIISRALLYSQRRWLLVLLVR
jgi:hypothetical protein